MDETPQARFPCINLGTRHWQATYTQARHSKEFYLQDEPQDFGSLSLSYFH